VHNQETFVGMADITHNLLPCNALAQALIQPQQVIQVIQTSLKMHEVTTVCDHKGRPYLSGLRPYMNSHYAS